MSPNPPLQSLPFLFLPFLLPAMASTPAPSNLPQVDFSRMGSVGFGGSFVGLDWWSDDSPFASSSTSSNSSSTPSFSANGDTLFLRASNGSYKPLGTTNSGGSVSTLCWSNATDSTNGTLYIGGSFSSISGTDATNIASYSIASSTISSLSSGLSGHVEALYCDNPRGQVWVGGSFSAPSGSGANVALWKPSSSSWSAVPFGGLNGAVTTIDPSANGSSIYFGGHFTTAFASNTSQAINSTTTAGNITSVPSAPNNTATTGNSGYLTPVTLPYTGYSDPNDQISITASSTTDQRLYSDPHVLVCPGEGIWLAQDDTMSNVDIVGVNYVRATGARVVNGLVDGRGATSFSLTSYPDNAQVGLIYTDPMTGQNHTCDSSCPLYTDSSIVAQDFIFADGAKNMTGLQMQLKTWQGAGAGLGSVQLLTDGAQGSAVAAVNKPLCPGRHPSSSVQQTGDWQTKTYTTANPPTINYYLTSSVPTDATTSPSVTFFPYVSSSAIYQVYIVIPGCLSLGDCDARTSVDIEVFPVQGGLGWSRTISEQVQEDTMTLVYSGPVDGSSENFQPTVMLSLSKNPLAAASGTTYALVAYGVEMILTDVSSSSTSNSGRTSGMSPNGTTTTNSTLSGDASVSFGVFEYVQSSTADINAFSSTLSNSSETALSKLGMTIDAAFNASSSPSGWAINAIATSGNLIYAGGDFSVSGNYTNVVAVDTTSGQSTSLDMMGLNGAVYAATVVDDAVYFGGAFTSTASSGGTNLNSLAKWDIKGQSWSSLGKGVDGVVTDLVVSPANTKQIMVLGNFSTAIGSNGTSFTTGGYAIWNTVASDWTSTGIVYGNVSTAAVTPSGEQSFLAGRVSGSSLNSVHGVAMLSTGSGGAPEISTYNLDFGSVGSALTPSSKSQSKRAHIPTRSSLTRDFLSRFTDSFSPRSKLGLLQTRDTPPSIPATSAPAPAVLAGAFWTNSSADGKMVTILGGNFTSTNGSTDIEGVAFYTESFGLSGPNPPVVGLVRALNVIGQNVYVGGQGINVSDVGSGLVVYNLDKREWIKGGMSSLNPASGSEVIVNVIRSRINTNTVVVAGSFMTAGSLSCAAVCLWDTEQAQWSTLGSGLSGGEVRAVDFSGQNDEMVVVAGSFALSNGDISYVASYAFGNSTWTPLGSLPGPALAVAVDDKNATNVFAAGYSTSDGTPYLQQWDGKTWSEQNSTLLPGSLVQQLAFVPMSVEHTSAGSIEKDRMLMVSGDLVLENAGNATSALYDGAAMHPYLVGSSSSGAVGSGYQLFWSSPTFSFNVHHFLARGLVVLVAIAIATGLILLLILVFFLIACLNRRRGRNKAPPKDMFEKDRTSEISSTHQNVFNNVQAALEQSLLGVGTAGAAANRVSDPSTYDTAPGDEGDYGEEGRESTMRYDFDGPELQPGEMSMRQGQRVVILDDVQSDEWWYARDPATGREGVIPATYAW